MKKATICRFFSCVLALLILCSSVTWTGAEAQNKLKTMADFRGKKISMLNGTAFDVYMEKNSVLQGDVTVLYQNSDVDSISSLLSGKSDAIAMDKPVAEMVVSDHDELMIFPEVITEDLLGYGLQKGSPLAAPFNQAMGKLMSEGLGEKLTAKWMGKDEDAKKLIPQDWEGKNGTLRYWVNTGSPPMSYLGPEGTPVGFAVDLMLHIAKEMDYMVEITECAFDGLIPALQAGKADLAGRSMSITEERKQMIDFSDPFYYSGSVMVVKKEDVDPSLLSAPSASGKLKTMADFRGRKISMLNGTSFDVQMEKNSVLQGDVTVLYQNSDVDSIAALLSGKCDAIAMDKPIAEMVISDHDELMIFPEIIMEDAFGFGFQKGSQLVQAFNTAMNKLFSQGLSGALIAKWMGKGEDAKVLIPQDWEGKNGTLRYWVNTGTPPMSYLGPEGTPIGFTVDLLLHVAREMDYKVEITECAFDGLIPALQAGKADLAGRSMSITEERLKMIDFSDPFYLGGSVMVIRKADADESLLLSTETGSVPGAPAAQGIFDSIANSFRRTFLEDNRWEVFVTGLLNTLLITFSSMLFGCVLGFALFLLCRKTGKVVQGIVQGITGVIVGIPAVVLLMVLFYVVFGKSNISGIPVSIIAFTLTFGTSVLHMLEAGTGAVDYGQTEGAYALGFSDNATFFRVVFPQAVLHILPIFKGEVSSLLKATAVVGYIAVQDLTRSGDMVRNRTFEAFFSLISVAVIYYAIGKLMGFLVNKLQSRINPARRKTARILKGVNYHV